MLLHPLVAHKQARLKETSCIKCPKQSVIKWRHKLIPSLFYKQLKFNYLIYIYEKVFNTAIRKWMV